MEFNVENLKAIKKSGFTMALIQLIIGILFIFIPWVLPSSVMVIISVLTIIVGILCICIIMYRPKELVSWKSFVMPVVIIGIGVFILLNPTTTITIIAWAFAAATILKGIGTLFFNDLPVNRKKYRVFGIVSIVIGIVIIILAQDAANIQKLISYVIGIDLIFHAVVDFMINHDLGKIIKSAGDSEVVTIELN